MSVSSPIEIYGLYMGRIYVTEQHKYLLNSSLRNLTLLLWFISVIIINVVIIIMIIYSTIKLSKSVRIRRYTSAFIHLSKQEKKNNNPINALSRLVVYFFVLLFFFVFLLFFFLL